jgi:hypothetical protein
MVLGLFMANNTHAILPFIYRSNNFVLSQMQLTTFFPIIYRFKKFELDQIKAEKKLAEALVSNTNVL